MIIVFLLFITTKSTPCDYCKYCDFCGYCQECPCSGKKGCEFCGYCKYCPLCKWGPCDTLCGTDSIFERIASFFGVGSHADIPKDQVPEVAEIDQKLKAAGIDLNKVPKKKEL